MEWNETIKHLRGNKTIEKVCKDINLNPNAYMAYESGERIPLPSVKAIIDGYYDMNKALNE